MGRSLAAYHINNELVGVFIKEHMASVGKSQRQVAAECGITEDHLSLICRGCAKNIAFETLVKLAVACRFSVCDLLQEVVSPDDVDFQIVVKTDHHIISAAKNTDATVLPAEITEPALKFLDDHYKASIARYEKQIGILCEEHDKDLAAIGSSHAETVSTLKVVLKRLRIRDTILSILFFLLCVAIVIGIIYDACTRGVGFIP